MAQPGRRSAAAASVLRLAPNRARPRLSPPTALTKDERMIFDLVAAENQHLAATDAPLLAAFAQASIKVFKLAKKEDVAAWERACRVQAMYSTKLRISPQTCTDPQSIGRRRKDAEAFGPLRKPWLDYGDDEDEGEPVRPPRSADFRSERQKAEGIRFPGNDDD
jgi:hypothetical protein